MSRTAHLESLYLKITYSMFEEEKQPQPSEAVIIACKMAKKVISREYYAILDRRAGVAAEHRHV